MNINKDSFQFNFYMISIVAALISIIIIVSALLYINNIVEVNDNYTSLREPLVYNAQMSNVDINKHSHYFQTYLMFGEKEHKEQADYWIMEKLPSRLKAILKYANRSEDRKFYELALDLKNKLDEMQTTYKEFDTTDDQKALFREKYFSMIVNYGEAAKAINDYNFDNYGDKLVNIFNNLNRYKYSGLVGIVIFFSFLFYIINRTRNKVYKGIQKVKSDINIVALGNIPDTIEESNNELIKVDQALVKLVENLKTVRLFAKEVGKGNFDTDLTVFDNTGDLGESLAEMRLSLKKVAEEGKIRDWSNSGLTKINALIQENTNNLEQLTIRLIELLVKYTDSVQGGLFLTEGEEDEIILELMSAYAYDRNKFLKKTIKPGQGLVGQAYLEQGPIYLTEVPENYINVRSGLGGANPTSIYIQPMIANEKVAGIIEIASFQEYPDYVREFMVEASESIASAISTVKNNRNLNRILGESNEMTEQLKSQEEELRQNTEELQATQEDMSRRISELEEENEQLKKDLEKQ